MFLLVYQTWSLSSASHVAMTAAHNCRYKKLKKPSWTPPNLLFGPMWTLLYGAMSVASWMVFKKGGWEAQVPHCPVLLLPTRRRPPEASRLPDRPNLLQGYSRQCCTYVLELHVHHITCTHEPVGLRAI